MTPREADRLIRSGEVVRLHDTHFGEEFSGRLVRRTRWDVEVAYGTPERVGLFDRGDLEVLRG